MQEENWLIGSVASAKLVNLPLPTCPCSMETEFFLEKEHQFNHNFPSLFISNNTLNADKCILFHRTISVLDINKLRLNTFLTIPVLKLFFFKWQFFTVLILQQQIIVVHIWKHLKRTNDKLANSGATCSLGRAISPQIPKTQWEPGDRGPLWEWLGTSEAFPRPPLGEFFI